MPPLPPRVLPVGDSAASVEFGDAIRADLNARVRALDQALAEAPFPGLREAVPSHRALLVVYDPARLGWAEASALLLERAAAGAAPPQGGRHEIPTLYGGDDGPDLGDVARARGSSERDVVALHSSTEYTAFMLGFTPGFAYLGLLPEALELPRRATPRTRVPAGSVAIAGRQTAVYPVASPGGWHLIGRTSLRLFDPLADPPARIAPGDRVRFVPVERLDDPEPPAAVPVTAGDAGLEVLEPGLLTTVQDGGRFGLRRLGVTWAGPMDAAALADANGRVANPPGAAGLEATLSGPTLRFLRTARFCVSGADLGAVLHRPDLGPWPVPPGTAVLARAGNVLTFSGRRAGVRCYIAVAGGIDVPDVLGSRATDLAGGFGGLEGRPLRGGDRLGIGPAPEAGRTPEAPMVLPTTAPMRVVLGPQHDHLTPAAVDALLAAEWRVTSASDRTGCRLEGPRLTHRAEAEIVSDGMLPGCIQVPPDGQPIVMAADSPTTGGYPKVATVVTADLDRLAQLVPGQDQVRFEPVTVEEAQRLQR